MRQKSSKHIKLHYSFLQVMTGYDLSIRRIPLMEIESKNKGGLVILTACMHGDEIGGTVVIQELFKILQNTLLCGKIIAFPLLNPFGFENSSRRISISNEDLNRSFPGNKSGTLAQRIAAIVMEKIIDLKPEIVLDLHNDWNNSIPYVLIDFVKEPERVSVLHHFAKTSGLPAIQESERTQGSFSHTMNENNIPALTFELGESLIINEKNVAYGISAVLNILNELGMINSPENAIHYIPPDEVINKILTYSSSPLCSSSGIIRFMKKSGSLVKEGEKLARVYNVFGRLTETIISLHRGIILGHNDYAVAFPGSQVMAFGVFKD